MPKAKAKKKGKRPNPDPNKEKGRRGWKPPNKQRMANGGTVHTWATGQGHVNVGKGTIDVLTGKEDLTKWSDEELMMGLRPHNNRSGNRRGMALQPRVIPVEIYQELASRIVSRVRHRFAAELEYAVNEHIKIIKAPFDVVPASVKLKAIELLYDRVMGKAEEHVQIDVRNTKWHRAIAMGIVATEQQAIEAAKNEAEDIVEGEIVDEEDDG